MQGRTEKHWNTAELAGIAGIGNILLLVFAPCILGMSIAHSREPASTILASISLVCFMTLAALGPVALALGLHSGITSFTEGKPESRRLATAGVVGGFLATLATSVVLYMAWCVSRLP